MTNWFDEDFHRTDCWFSSWKTFRSSVLNRYIFSNDTSAHSREFVRNARGFFAWPKRFLSPWKDSRIRYRNEWWNPISKHFAFNVPSGNAGFGYIRTTRVFPEWNRRQGDANAMRWMHLERPPKACVLLIKRMRARVTWLKVKLTRDAVTTSIIAWHAAQQRRNRIELWLQSRKCSYVTTKDMINCQLHFF